MHEILQLGRTFGKCLSSLGSRKVGVKHSCSLRVIIVITLYDAGIAQESQRYLLMGARRAMSMSGGDRRILYGDGSSTFGSS